MAIVSNPHFGIDMNRRNLKARIIPSKAKNAPKSANGFKPRLGTPMPKRNAPRTPKAVTSEQLDQDLESYIQKTRTALNADLDAFMSQMNRH